MDANELEKKLSKFLEHLGQMHSANMLLLAGFAHALTENGMLTKDEVRESIRFIRQQLPIEGTVANAGVDEFVKYMDRDWPSLPKAKQQLKKDRK